MTVSVCTLAHGRAAHLANLVRGLDRSTLRPLELVIAVLQEEDYVLPETSFLVRQIRPGATGLSLAKARNAAAGAARGDLLVFLDVDCIPNATLIADYINAAALAEGLFMGEVGYLPKGAPVDRLDDAVFDAMSIRHSERAGPPNGVLGECRDYRCFWSLNFAMLRAAFERTGGFDEAFVGYGGEDTDFGRSCMAAGLPIWWVRGAKAYHQYHPHHMPPVHHIDSVIANAAIFAEKWGEPTMQHWLRAFRLMGLADSVDGVWRRTREVVEADLRLTRQQEDQPYASTRAVLNILEHQAAG